MLYVSLLVLVATARGTMIKTQAGKVCRPKGNPNGGYCTIPSYVQQITPAQCLQKCEGWSDCVCGVASDLKNGAFYCHLFVGENVAPDKTVCEQVLGEPKAVAGLYQPYGALKCGSKYAVGDSADQSVSVYESDFEFADATCPKVTNGKVRSSVGKTCRPKGNPNGGYCTIPNNKGQLTTEGCLKACEESDWCKCGVASPVGQVTYCHLFTDRNVAPAQQDCQKALGVEAIAGLYFPYGAMKCDSSFPFGDADNKLSVAVHDPNFKYKETCISNSNYVRSAKGKTCRPNGNPNGGYCTIPSFAKQYTPEECLTKCESWDKCVCGIASDLKNGSFYCHLFSGENVAPTKAECEQVFGSTTAVQGLYQPWGALKCNSVYPLGDAEGETVSVHDKTFVYKENCPVPTPKPVAEPTAANTKLVRSASGKTCRPSGNPNGGYCTIPSSSKQIAPEECLSKCESWDRCVCGIASDLKNGAFYCHLFVGENVAPTKAECEKVFGNAASVQGLYQPFGALKCNSKYALGDAEGKTVSVHDPTFVYKEACPVSKLVRSESGKTCRPNGSQNGGYCTIPSFSKQYSPEDCLTKCENWDKCVCGIATDLKNGSFYCHLFTGENVAPTKADCEKVFDSDVAVQGLYQPWGALKCNSRYPFGDAEGKTVSIRDPTFVYKEACPKATIAPQPTPAPTTAVIVTPKPSDGECDWQLVADGYIGGNQPSGWGWGSHGDLSLKACQAKCHATSGCKAIDYQTDRCNMRSCSLLDSNCEADRVPNKVGIYGGWNVYECRQGESKPVESKKINCFASEFVRQKVQTATSGNNAREHEAVSGSGMVTNFAKDTMSGGVEGCKTYCAGTKYAVWWINTAVTAGEYSSHFCRCHNVCVDKTAKDVYEATVYDLETKPVTQGDDCGKVGRIHKGTHYEKFKMPNTKTSCECATSCKNKGATEWAYKARNEKCRCFKNAKIVDFTTARKRTTVGYFDASNAIVLN